MPPLRRPAAERFERFVYPDPNSGCHIWAGATARKGYGSFQNAGRIRVQAHRFAWELANGPIPAGLNVLHKCDTPCCVNPDHLFLGTLQDNASDTARKQRGKRSVRGLPYGAHPQVRGGGFQARTQVAGVVYRMGTYRTANEASAVALAKKFELLANRRKENP